MTKKLAATAVPAACVVSKTPDRLLKKLFSLPLADARGSVTPAESAEAFFSSLPRL
jgi:hypothetical protein